MSLPSLLICSCIDSVNRYCLPFLQPGAGQGEAKRTPSIKHQTAQRPCIPATVSSRHTGPSSAQSQSNVASACLQHPLQQGRPFPLPAESLTQPALPLAPPAPLRQNPLAVRGTREAALGKRGRCPERRAVRGETSSLPYQAPCFPLALHWPLGPWDPSEGGLAMNWLETLPVALSCPSPSCRCPRVRGQQVSNPACSFNAQNKTLLTDELNGFK